MPSPQRGAPTGAHHEQPPRRPQRCARREPNLRRPSEATAERCRTAVDRYDRGMPERHVITPHEMDRMSPSERAEAVLAGELHSLDELPEAFRRRVVERAAAIEARLSPNR